MVTFKKTVINGVLVRNKSDLDEIGRVYEWGGRGWWANTDTFYRFKWRFKKNIFFINFVVSVNIVQHIFIDIFFFWSDFSHLTFSSHRYCTNWKGFVKSFKNFWYIFFAFFLCNYLLILKHTYMCIAIYIIIRNE